MSGLISMVRPVVGRVRGRPALPLVIIGLSVALAAFGPLIAPYDPEATNPNDALQPPGLKHWFGTDQLGMDVFSRVIAAPRVDLVIALTAVAMSAILGLALGLLAATAGRVTSGAIMRVADITQSLPVFITSMALVSFSGQNIRNVTLALALVITPQFLRLVRDQAVLVKGQAYVEAAQVARTPRLRILLRHILPNSIEPMMVHASVMIGFAMLLTAGLSFIGAGVRVPTPEWGSMIAVGAPSMITGQWWASIFPGVALAITVLGWAVVGEAAGRRLEGGPVGILIRPEPVR